MAENSRLINLFKHFREDLRRSRSTPLPTASKDLLVSMIIIPIDQPGTPNGEKKVDHFPPVAFEAAFFEQEGTNIPNTNEVFVGIYFSEIDATAAHGKAQSQIASDQFFLGIQAVTLQEAIEKTGAAGFPACLVFNGDNKLYLPSSQTRDYYQLILDSSFAFDHPCDRVSEWSQRLGVDLLFAGTIYESMKPFLGLVDVDVSLEHLPGKDPRVQISVTELSGKPSLAVLGPILQRQCGHLVKELADFKSTKVSGLRLELVPVKALAIGERSFA